MFRPSGDDDHVCRFITLDRPEDRPGLVDEWRDLVSSLRRPGSFFAIPAVQRAMRQLTAGEIKYKTIAVYRAGRLVGLLPAMIGPVWRGPRLGVRYDYSAADRRFLTTRTVRPIPLRQLSSVLSLPATNLGPGLICRGMGA